MLFADRNMGQHILGLPLDAEATQFFNPLFIFILSPLFSWLWIKLDHKGLNPSSVSKFTLGVLFIALGFFELAYGSQHYAVNGVTSPWWLAISYLLQTTGELLLSPIGLSMITQFAPRKHTGKMMGVWFLSLAAAYAISARLATIADVPNNLSAAQSLPIYTHAFYLYGIIALGLTVLSFICIPFVNRLTR
jgi:POT family proton-dependent oligopeptide transporter